MDTQNNLEGKDISIWIDTTAHTNFPILNKQISYDVVIVGAGITGITAALLLQKEGLKVVLIERKKVVEKTTGKTTAKVTALQSTIYQELIAKHGKEKANTYAKANLAAVEKVKSLIEEYRIDCDFVLTSAFTYASSEKDSDKIKKEVEVVNSLGLMANYVDSLSLPFPTYGAIELPDQLQFHPRKYTLALLEEFIKLGGKVFEQSKAVEIEEDGSRLSVILENKQGKVKAKYIVVATHIPFMNLDLYHQRTTRWRDYAVALQINGPAPQGMYISSGETDYHSIRSHPFEGSEILIIDGEGHDDPEEKEDPTRYQKLINWAKQNFSVKEIKYYWNAYDFTSKDKLPFIGRSSQHTGEIYIATGFGGWGMSNGTAAAMLISDLVLGRDNPFKELYNPSR